MRDLWTSARSDKEPEAAAENSTEAEDASSNAAEPRNVVLKVLYYLLAAIVWVVYSVGKALFYTVVVALFLVISVIELVLELIVLPFALLLRFTRQARWPVEIGRQGEHFGTHHAEDYTGAGALRDGLVAQIERGDLAADQQGAAA